MEKRDALAKILAVAGTFLAWVPILAPVALTVVFFLQTGLFRFDYLMPAELFLSALGGGCLLLWAALRARSHRGLIGGSLAAAAACLAASQGAAVATGLASGTTEPAGWPLVLVLILLAGYVLAVMACAVGGLLLTRVLLAGAGGAPEQRASPS
jgi:hypothetical protein